MISIADKVVELIYLKYLKAKISYVRDRRVEIYPFARDAVREAVYNAIAHNCYMFGTPIQIRIEKNAIIVSNRCVLPEGWTIETLLAPHESVPYNPDIANVFYKAGYIETWGRGIQKIYDACIELGAGKPKYELIGNGLRVHLPALKRLLVDDNIQENYQSANLAERILVLIAADPAISQKALSQQLGISVRSLQRILNELKEYGKIRRVGGKRFGKWVIN